MIPLEKLDSLHFLSGASPAALNRLAQEMISMTYAKGDVVIEEGSLSGSLFLIAKGSVSVQKKLDEERTKTVAKLGPEEFFGEMSFLENKPHSARIVAEEDTEVLTLPRESLDDVIKKDPKLALEQILTLLSGVSSRLRSTTRELVTVFEVSRLMGASMPLEEVIPQIVKQLQNDLSPVVTVAFYRWNPFNDEFKLGTVEGPASGIFSTANTLDVPSVKRPERAFFNIEDISSSSGVVIPFPFNSGHLILAHSAMEGTRDGLFVFYNEAPRSFTPGQRQLMETIAAVLAPALATARTREEELSRQRLERGKPGASL